MGTCTSTWCHMVVTCATANLSVKLSTAKSPLFPAASQATKMNTKSPEKQILCLYFLISGLPFSAVEQHQSFCLSQSDRVIGHTSAALQQDLVPKHPKPATSAVCSKAQNITDHIFKDQVLRVAKESCHVKAIESADRFSTL